MSKKAQNRIKNAVNWLAMATPKKQVYNTKTKKVSFFQLGLITLTLPSKQIHTDLQIKKEILQPFLDYCRKKWLLKNYIWRAETQANDNIHFHIIIDKFIHKKAINSVWNYMLKRLNYEGGKASTRIEQIKKVNDIGAYMAKYMSKNDKDRRPVIGKLWGTSESLSEKNTKCVTEERNPEEGFSKVLSAATSKRKELIIYSKEDKQKERGFYIGDLLLYNWKNLLYRSENFLKDCINSVINKINQHTYQYSIIYESS
jgi:hypothetical protein